eukprot:385571_1
MSWLLHYILCFCVYISNVIGESVQFSNITNLVNLSALFFNDENIPFQYAPEPRTCYITNYMDKTRNLEYHWLSQSIRNMYEAEPVDAYDAENIYDDYLMQYYNEINTISNQIPFRFQMSQRDFSICTSPKTDDILECYIQTRKDGSFGYIDWVDCHIFYNNNSQSSYWSFPIDVSGEIKGIRELQILCFDDAYFILYSVTYYPTYYAYSLLDLNQNLIQKNVSFYPYSYESNSRRFTLSVNPNDGDNTFLFQQYFTNETNGYLNITVWIDNVIMKYTNINDQQPIYILDDKRYNLNGVQYTVNNRNYSISSILITGSITLPLESNPIWKPSECCYIITYSLMFGNSFWNGYLMIFDFNGNMIGNPTYIKNQDLTYNNIQSLKSISDTKKHYFVIFYNTDKVKEYIRIRDFVGTVYYFNKKKELFELNTNVFLNHNPDIYGSLLASCSNIIAKDTNMILIQARTIFNRSLGRYNPAVFAQSYRLSIIN